MTSFMALDGVTSFLRLKNVTITCKRMRRSLNIGGSFRCNGGKLEEAEDFECVFVVYCVLEYNTSTKINHSRCALRARDLIFFTTDLQTVNYYSTIHCWG